MGGTGWANVSTQYYQTDSSGNQQYISNDKDVLGGIWVDDSNDITGLAKTNSTNPAGSTNTYFDLAMEAYRAAAHFGVSGAGLTDANFVIIQPPAVQRPERDRLRLLRVPRLHALWRSRQRLLQGDVPEAALVHQTCRTRWQSTRVG